MCLEALKSGGGIDSFKTLSDTPTCDVRKDDLKSWGVLKPGLRTKLLNGHAEIATKKFDC